MMLSYLKTENMRMEKETTQIRVRMNIRMSASRCLALKRAAGAGVVVTLSACILVTIPGRNGERLGNFCLA